MLSKKKYLWCQIEWHRAQSTQASRCLNQTKPLCAWLVLSSPPGRGGGTTSSPAEKKKEIRMLVHCPIYFAFSITMLWGVHQGDCSFFLHCRSIYYVACRCLCGLLHPKKKTTREMHLLRRFTVGNGRTRFFPSGAVLSQRLVPAVEAVSAPTMALYCS